MVIVTLMGQRNSEERVRGVTDALKKYPGVQVIQTIDDKGDPRAAEDAIAALLTKKEKIDGIICLEASGGEGAADALHRLDMTEKISIVAFDKDPQAIETARAIADKRFEIVHDSFVALSSATSVRGIGRLSGVLLDLGVSSPP